MRKITKQSLSAFFAGVNFSSGNMTVHDHGQVVEMRLHGNLIAERVKITGEVFISDAGWQTVTTKDRLNAICHHLGADGISQRQWVWYRNGEEFPSNTMVCINHD